jgi:tetratricopeptide (TPR) repeat protein
MIPMPRALPSRPSALRRLRLPALAATLVAVGACAGGYEPPEAPSPERIPQLEQAAAQAPGSPAPRVRLAAAYREADRLDEAEALLSEVLERNPDHGPAVYFLGLTYEDQGADSAALALYGRYVAEGEDEELRAALASRREVVRRRVLRETVRAALSREEELADLPVQPRTVAVFPFDYLGADPELRPLARALAEMLVTDLSQTDRLTVLERLAIQYVHDELGLAASQRVDPATALRSGRILGAERVVQGQLDGSSADLLLQAAVVEGAAEPEAASRVSARDDLEAFFEMQTELALGIYEALGIELTPAERDRVTRRPTENIAALLEFGLGLEAQDAGRFTEARGHFQQARTLDPSFDMAGAAEAQAQALGAASALGPDGLAELGYGELGETWAQAEELVRQIEFLPLETLVPGILDRDPIVEALGQEGVTPSTATLEILLPRPPGEDR